jgi:hypothetical protein
MRAVIEKLLMDEKSLLHIKLTSNRPNIVLATHPIVGSITDYSNLAFLLPSAPLSIADIPRAIVFVDNRKYGKAAVDYLMSLLPQSLRTLSDAPVRHYDSMMSKRYLQKTYDDFRDMDGSCRVLFGTEAVSTVRDK